MKHRNNLIETVIEKIKEKKCRNLVKLNVGEVTDLTESFIICTSNSDIQSRAVVDAISEELKKKDKYAHSIEGYEMAKWILMDYIAPKTLKIIIRALLRLKNMYHEIDVIH